MAKSSKKRHTSKGKRGKTTTKRASSKSKKGVTKIKYESTKEIKIEQALMDNFVALQKVMVNLAGKFDNLSTQISKLLDLFEISAKSLARKDFEGEKENKDVKNLSNRMDNIAQQAGLIGKGLALIHEVHKEKGNPNPFVPGSPPQEPSRPRFQSPMPRPQMQQRQMQRPGLMNRVQPNSQHNSANTPMPKPMAQDEKPLSLEGYEKSISSNMPKE